MRTILLFTILQFVSITISAKTGKEIIMENGFKKVVQPMIETSWAQSGGGINETLPIVNLQTGEKGAAGCGAIALAQIMKYWNYPQIGNGENFYVWEHPQTKACICRYANYDIRYQWDKMANTYRNNEHHSQDEITAVNRLISDIGIALEMKYTLTKDNNPSTATQIEYISTVLKKYWGYNPYLHLVVSASGGYTKEEWLTLIYKELSEGRPIIMGGNNAKGHRHIFIADGYDSEGNIHMNLGHDKASENIYYNLNKDSFEGTSEYFINMRMLIGISPSEIPIETITLKLEQPGTLLETMGGVRESKKICRLKIVGELDQTDIYLLRNLCCSDVGQSNISHIGNLSYLDLSEATIDKDQLPDSAFYANKQEPCYSLQTIILPKNLKRIGDNAFKNCVGLYYVILPENLESIGQQAFFGCRYLDNLNIPGTIKKIGKSVFAYDKMRNINIDMKSGLGFELIENALVDVGNHSILSYMGKDDGTYVVPDSISSIKSYSFAGKGRLTSIVLPERLKSIETKAFEKCVSVKHVYCYAKEPPQISSDAFTPEFNDCSLHILRGYKEKYSTTEWKNFANIIDDLELPSNLSFITSINEALMPDYTIKGIPTTTKHGLLIKNGKKIIAK